MIVCDTDKEADLLRQLIDVGVKAGAFQNLTTAVQVAQLIKIKEEESCQAKKIDA